MDAVLSGLADDSTEQNPYTLRGNEDDIELSREDAIAKVDTQAEEIDAYVQNSK